MSLRYCPSESTATMAMAINTAIIARQGERGVIARPSALRPRVVSDCFPVHALDRDRCVSRATTPVPSKEKQQAGTGCVRLFLLPFLVMGCLFFYLIAVKPLWNIWRARDWVSVPCRILASDLQQNRGSKGTTYKAVIKFTYQVEGRAFAADGHSFFNSFSSGYAGQKKIVDQYPPGAQVTCFVNPRNPGEAVLYRGPTHMLWWGLFPLPFIAIGSLAFLPARFLTNRSFRNGPIRDTVARSFGFHETPSESLQAATDGPAELKARTSPVVKLLGSIAIALFWNGIVSVFVWNAWKGIERGRPEWPLIIFLIPFVLVGLALVGAVVHSFLNLFNPRITLTVSSSAVPLGSTLEAQWSFRGNVRRLRDLRIVLEGAERAIYRRGTRTSTDVHVFATIPLVETTEPGSIRSCSVRVTVPEDLMHSFKAPNNEIIWKLKVKGSIPRFPDVSEEFAFTVLPHGSTAS